MKDISIEMTIWCSRCANWTQDTFMRKYGLKANRDAVARLAGWVVIKGRVVCHECIEKERTTCPTSEPN